MMSNMDGNVTAHVKEEKVENDGKVKVTSSTGGIGSGQNKAHSKTFDEIYKTHTIRPISDLKNQGSTCLKPQHSR